MASINLTAPSSSRVFKTYGSCLGNYTLSYGPKVRGEIRQYYNGITIRVSDGSGSASVNDSSNNGGSFTVNFSNAPAGSAITITATLKYTSEECVINYSTEYYFTHNGKTYTSSSRSDCVEARAEFIAAGEECSSIESRQVADGLKWVKGPSGSVSSSAITIYTRPNNFYFNGSSSTVAGLQWRVDSGIQSLLTNIYNFDSVAVAWKKWKDQTGSPGSCSTFVKNNNISASMFETAYNYLGKSVPSGCSSGQILKASFFSGLESALNS